MTMFRFEVELKNGRTKKVHAMSQNINGAVRKVLQENEIERFIRILSC